MNVLIIHRYFWPDSPPYAQMLFHIAKHLASKGYGVSVLSSMPSHHGVEDLKSTPLFEVVDGVSIRRLYLLKEWNRNIVLRLINTVLFAIRVFFRVLFANVDVVMIASTPPVIMAFAVRIAAQLSRKKYVYHCQDIHPEASVIGNMVSKGWFYRLLRKIDKDNVESASATIVLSKDMEKTLVSRGVNSDNIHIINNFIFEKTEIIDDRLTFGESLKVLFAGNLGYLQNLEQVVQVAHRLSDLPIEFIFMGEGVSKSKLVEAAKGLEDKSVFFLGYKPTLDALQTMYEADLGIISLTKGIIDVAYPSKTMMYLSTGLSVLALLEPESELGQFIEANNLGFVVQPNQEDALVNILMKALEDKSNLRTSKDRVANLANGTFGKEVILAKWGKLFDNVFNN